MTQRLRIVIVEDVAADAELMALRLGKNVRKRWATTRG
jgi:hypothetical protein